MARLATVLLAISSCRRRCLAFSPPAARSWPDGTALYQDKAATSSDATTDSSYEALRKKFGLTNEPVVQTESLSDAASIIDVEKIDTEEEESVLSELESVEPIDADPSLAELTDINGFDEVTEPPNEEIIIEDSYEINPEIKTAPDLGAIYSRKFSRYNIPVTTNGSTSKDEIKKELEDRRERRLQRGVIVKLKPESGISDVGFFDGLFRRGRNMLSASARSADSSLREAYSGKPFRWVTSDSYKANSNTKSNSDEDFVAASAFWRMAAEISLQIGTGNKQSFLALPETSLSVAQHLCDIINWYANFLENDNEQENVRERATMILRATLDSTHSSSIPIVEFTTVYKFGADRPKLQRQNDEQPTPEDTEKRTKSWVQRVLVQMSVCPFTKSNVKSGQGLGDVGVPVANILYRHSNASHTKHGTSAEMYTLMADTWEAICDMIAAGPSGKHGVSSILLSAPSFDDNFSLWAGPVFAMLEAGVSAIQAEEIIGVVCFHPKYQTPDGSTFPGFGHMHSLPRLKKWYNQFSSSSKPLSDNEIAAGGAWQRRTPHAVINVLRAEQLEVAEGRRESGILYERNIRVLVGREEGVGCEQLEQDLRREQSM